MHGQIGFEDNQERAPTEKGSTFWFTAQFAVDEEHEIEHPHFEHLQVVSYLAHPATASVLRYYLENYQVPHIETQSILDLFSRLKHLDQKTIHGSLLIIVVILKLYSKKSVAAIKVT